MLKARGPVFHKSHQFGGTNFDKIRGVRSEVYEYTRATSNKEFY